MRLQRGYREAVRSYTGGFNICHTEAIKKAIKDSIKEAIKRVSRSYEGICKNAIKML